ncbi:MAG: hypothetical protein ACM34J_12975, partial [Ignavibacteria bacterium]
MIKYGALTIFSITSISSSTDILYQNVFHNLFHVFYNFIYSDNAVLSTPNRSNGFLLKLSLNKKTVRIM